MVGARLYEGYAVWGHTREGLYDKWTQAVRNVNGGVRYTEFSGVGP